MFDNNNFKFFELLFKNLLDIKQILNIRVYFFIFLEKFLLTFKIIFLFINLI